MDYEKKYKESMAKMSKFLAKHDGFTISKDGEMYNELSEIFSELKESEDEKIRRWIINYLDNKAINSGIIQEKTNIKNAIAWLEKQGEQVTDLPRWKYKKDNTPLLRDSIILNKYGGIAKSPADALVSDVWVLDYDELAKLPKEEVEKQGEQKSIEYPLCKTVKDKIDYYIVNHFTTDTVVKTDVNSIVKAMEEGVRLGMKEQNPAWSEEDERNIERCITKIEIDKQNWEQNNQGKTMVDADNELINWLKSLSPQNRWKPSDKQIEALEWQVKNTYSGSWQYKFSKELLEQLKKLREE